MKVGSVKVNKTKEGNKVTSFFNTSKEGINNNNRAYFNFINSIKSPRSRKTYEVIIKRYMKYYDIQDINELLIDKNDLTIIENNIIDWLVALRDTVEYNTRYTYYTAITTFYEVNDVILRKKKISRFLGQQSTHASIKTEHIL